MMNTVLMLLLLEGFITISVEIITIRQLLPFFGGSVVITSIIIGVFLLFLAAGYWRGGAFRGHYIQRLARNFMLSFVWIGVGLAYFFIGLFLNVTLIWAKCSFITSLMLYLLLVLAPIVYWLGQTVPLATNLFNPEHRISRISGMALFLSTIGSFLGAIVTSVVLFQYVGVAWTIVLNCGLLLGLVVMLKPHSQLKWATVVALVLGWYAVKIFNVDVEHQLFIHTNNYGNYRVVQPNMDTRILEINLSQSSMLTSNKKAFPYAEWIKDLLFQQLNMHGKRILVLGAGGFSISAEGTHGNTFTYVDIDASIQTLAETHFLHEGIKGQFIARDARRFLNEDKTRYDVILADAYTNHIAIPPSLLTVEYFSALKAHLKPEGLLLVNMIANPFFLDKYSQRVHNTLSKVFPYCSITPLGFGKTANIMYLCSNVSKEDGVYSDDKSQATFDAFQQQNAHVNP